ncbi:MAG: hypothetical protein QN720_09665, partial [Nitrososphaeraceae archaeon]|nr:hypothetical protein [Nitrososphaeraceae archaeon]MDW0333232.1 hypothetical protein [Nitrososphaeraceae archaeon]
MLLSSDKNKRKSSLTMAIIIISLSLLPLNDDLSSILLLFSAEPVFAQLSAQGNIGIDNEAGTTTSSSSITAEQATNFEDFNGGRVNDDRQDNLIVATGSSLDFEDESVTYGEDQVSSIPFSSSSSSSSTMDFDFFLDSFADSIFNGTSTFGGVGTSIVNGIEVSGITIDKSQNRLSVILSNTATEVGIDNNITGTETTTTTASTSPTTAASNSVSVIAMRIPINIADILSMAAASSSNDNVLVNATGDFGENQDDAFSSDSFSPFSLLSNLQIGSSILIDVDWSEPQMVTMDLVGGSGSRGTSQEQEEQPQLNSDNMTTADFVLVSVIPYTGLVNNTTMSSATR